MTPKPEHYQSNEPLNDADRRLMLRHTARLAARLAIEHDALASTLRAMHGGYPSGGDGSRGTSPDSATERAALNADPARAARRQLDKAIRRAEAAMREADSIRHHWLTTEKGTPVGEGDPGCEIVEREGSWEPVFRVGDVNGNLPRSYRLGRWAYEVVRRTGALPLPKDVADHLAGRRMRRKAS